MLLGMNFKYGDKEISYLKGRDAKMAEVIERIGHIEREINPDVFSAVVFNIVGQQISMQAQETIWSRILRTLNDVTPENVLRIDEKDLKLCGISQGKVEYIKEFAEKVVEGEFDIEKLKELTDDETIKMLTKLSGVGVWTAEMVLLFSLGRMNVFSYNDFGIRRGLVLIYGIEKVDRSIFEHYRELFSPYCSVASLYLWEVSGKNMVL